MSNTNGAGSGEELRHHATPDAAATAAEIPSSGPVDCQVVPEDAEGRRIDEFAAHCFATVASRKQACKSARAGYLTLDGQPTEPQTRVRAGQVMRLYCRPERRGKVFPLHLEVIYEDQWLAVVNKPAGFPVNGNRFRTIENALPANLEPSDLPDALAWPRPVHRLDAPTTGLLLIAKSLSSLVALGRQFEDRSVQKAYHAVVTGRLEGAGAVDEPIDSRGAITRYEVVAHTQALRTTWLTTVRALPLTGRKHQIRRHLATLGHPILGDGLYGVPGNVLRGKGLFLCATELALKHPQDGREIGLTISEPAKFASLRERETRRWCKFRVQG